MEEEDYRFVELRDITEEKHYAEKLKEAYEERGVLLSDIHHRVKNNLAAVTGLLQLQKIHAGNDFVSASLDKSIQRINIIAQLHKELYTHDEFSHICLDEHIKRQLESLHDIYSDQNPELTLEVEMEKICVLTEQAMPVGLLVNEVLTNCFKYAFKGKSSGTVEIRLTESEQGMIELLIRDDGIGISNSSSTDDWSLGTTLIRSFAAQLDGDLEMLDAEGTGYRLTFMKQNSK